jgi:SNF2 family DNA or RNA helicase
LANIHLDLTPNNIEAGLFTLRNRLPQGGVLADEVGLGKTIEAALAQCQYWTVRSRRCSSINSFVELADVRHELRFDDRMESLRK